MSQPDWFACVIAYTCGPLESSLTRARLLESSLTRVRLLESSLACALMRDWLLHDTWQISVGF